MGLTNYTWDANGNLLGDGPASYSYDAANRAITITKGANTFPSPTMTYATASSRSRAA